LIAEVHAYKSFKCGSEIPGEKIGPFKPEPCIYLQN